MIGERNLFILYIILALIALTALWFAILYVSGLFVDGSKEYDKNSRYYRFLLNFSTDLAMKICRIRIKTMTLLSFQNRKTLKYLSSAGSYASAASWR